MSSSLTSPQTVDWSLVLKGTGSDGVRNGVCCVVEPARHTMKMTVIERVHQTWLKLSCVEQITPLCNNTPLTISSQFLVMLWDYIAIQVCSSTL